MKSKADSLMLVEVVDTRGERKMNVNDCNPEDIVLMPKTALQPGPCPECGTTTRGDCKDAERKLPSSNGVHAHASRHQQWNGDD